MEKIKNQNKQDEKVETNETNETTIAKNGNVSFKQTYLLSFNSEMLKTPLAKKVKEHIKNTISYNIDKCGFIDTITSDTTILTLNLMREMFAIRDKNDKHKIDDSDETTDEITTASQQNAKNAIVEFMQDNSITFIKKLIVKSLCEAYNGDNFKKVKETNTATRAEYILADSGFSFVKFVKQVMKKIITHNGKYKIVCDTETNTISYQVIDDVVEGIEE